MKIFYCMTFQFDAKFLCQNFHYLTNFDNNGILLFTILTIIYLYRATLTIVSQKCRALISLN